MGRDRGRLATPAARARRRRGRRLRRRRRDHADPEGPPDPAAERPPRDFARRPGRRARAAALG